MSFDMKSATCNVKTHKALLLTKVTKFNSEIKRKRKVKRIYGDNII